MRFTELNMKSPTIFYICNDHERALGLERKFPNLHIICIDDNSILEYLSYYGFKVFSLEQKLGKKNTIYRNSHKLLQHRLSQEYIRENTPEDKTPYVMFFKIAPNIEHLCKELGFKLLNTPAFYNRKYENKLS